MFKRGFRGWIKHADFIIVDAIFLNFAMILAYKVVFDGWLYLDSEYTNITILALISDLLVFLLFNTMHNVLQRGLYLEFLATLRHCSYVLLTIMLFMFFTKFTEDFSRTFTIFALSYYVIFGFFSRVLWKHIARNHINPAVHDKMVFALLSPDAAEDTMLRINHSPTKNYQITGIIINGQTSRTEIDGVPVVASIDKAADYICSEPVDAVFVDCSITDPSIKELMNACVQMGIPICYHIPAVFGEGNKYFTERFGGEYVLTSSLNYATIHEQVAKRAMDIAGGIVGSLMALLIILIVGPKIKKASPGPILYVQERIGLNGRRFKMYKIRSMCMDADKKKKDLMEQNRVEGGLMFKMDFDPRVIGNEILPDGTYKTGIGDFIRRTSLDEFPQFFNVLLGQMSLVGTRPPTLDEWEKYEFHHRARMACKPGITGLWQVSGRSDITDFEEVVALDTQYIVNWSVGLDIKILLKTIKVVFGRQGAK